MADLKTTIGLEIHVQLATKSKMFCRCDNQSFAEATDGKQSSAKAPNTVVCPICLGLPGTLPVTNKQAVLRTLKTGLALGCKINEIAKFDRKHYFYPDLPKGYQISQYDEPFASGGWLKLKVKSEKSKVEEECTIRLNRIHLEEDAGKLTHAHGESLVDLNRAGTPLMEIVTEPDLTSPKQAGDFLRKLQKIVRDVVAVSEASMEKGHLRCDANISITDGKAMSEIVEIKNLNSFKFVEKALAIEEEKLKSKYPDWPKKLTKETHGYNSDNNTTSIQRQKEEAADYRYFPEPDLPPFDSSVFDLEALKAEFNESEDEKIEQLIGLGVAEADAKVLANNKQKCKAFGEIGVYLDKADMGQLAKFIVNNYFGFDLAEADLAKAEDYAKAIQAVRTHGLPRAIFADVVSLIHNDDASFEDAYKNSAGNSLITPESISQTLDDVLSKNSAEVERYKNGEKQLIGFLMGQVMKELGKVASPQEVNKILKEKLET